MKYIFSRIINYLNIYINYNFIINNIGKLSHLCLKTRVNVNRKICNEIPKIINAKVKITKRIVEYIISNIIYC